MDLPAILALNNAHAVETSFLTAERLGELLAASFHLGLVDEGRTAFLLAFDQGSAYDSPNFLWFRARYERFAYVDRVVTAVPARGRGHARGLYACLFERAAEAGLDRVGCEVNVEPPNPASDALHAALGFAAVGQAELAGGKVVRYLLRAP